MDGNAEKPRVGNKPARPAPATADATEHRPAPRPMMETPVLPDNSADAARLDDDGEPVAAVEESCGGDGEAAEDNDHDDGDDEEQVERFYALLANIRAMRGQLSPRTAAGDDDDSTATRKKRLRRSAEPPWRPAFRMEDFEEPAPRPPPSSSSSSCKRKQTESAGHDDDSGARPHPVVVASSSSMPHAAVRPFQRSDSGSNNSRD